MNALNRTTRLMAVAAAATVTAALFVTVVSVAEPQRSALIAKNADAQALAAAQATVKLADAR